ncbi:MAG: IPT/TIG domain-containing protein [Thermoanaerobaculia bacterium]
MRLLLRGAAPVLALLATAAVVGRPSASERTPPPPRLAIAAPGRAPTIVNLRAIQFQWDFYAPGVVGGSSITLTAGQTYEFRIYSGDFKGLDGHGFSGVAAIGLPGGAILNSGEPPVVYTITPTTVGTFGFQCTNFCGLGHDGMVGTIQVVSDACPPTVSSISPTWGPVAGGSLVTLSGACFAPGATVTFGGAAATGVTVAATTITATTPPHAAGLVAVVVTNPDTQNATVPNGFKYGATGFFTVAPCRVVDTRNAAGPLGGPALAAGAGRTFTVTGQCNIPASAKAVSANVTVTGPSSGGHLTVFPGGTPLSTASTINFAAGQTRANNAVLPLDAAGRLGVRCVQASGATHFLLDVNGYFR